MKKYGWIIGAGVAVAGLYLLYKAKPVRGGLTEADLPYFEDEAINLRGEDGKMHILPISDIDKRAKITPGTYDLSSVLKGQTLKKGTELIAKEILPETRESGLSLWEKMLAILSSSPDALKTEIAVREMDKRGLIKASTSKTVRKLSAPEVDIISSAQRALGAGVPQSILNGRMTEFDKAVYGKLLAENDRTAQSLSLSTGTSSRASSSNAYTRSTSNARASSSSSKSSTSKKSSSSGDMRAASYKAKSAARRA